MRRRSRAADPSHTALPARRPQIMTIPVPAHLFAFSLILAVSAPPASATLVRFEDRIAIDLAVPGLVVEDFESSATDPGASGLGATGLAVIAGPLNAASSNAVFAPGDVAPGARFDAGFGSEPPAVLGTQALPGLPSQVLGAADPGRILNIRLDPGNYHLGFDLWTVGSFTQLVSELIMIEVYDPFGGLLASHEVVASPQGPEFYGISTDGVGIGRVSVFSASTSSVWITPLIDNVAFGAASPGSGLGGGLGGNLGGGLGGDPGAAELPEPATWTLLLAGLALTRFGRRKRA